MRQAGRLYEKRDEVTKDDLMTIEEADIRASSLFDEESPDDEPDEKHAPGNTS